MFFDFCDELIPLNYNVMVNKILVATQAGTFECRLSRVDICCKYFEMLRGVITSRVLTCQSFRFRLVVPGQQVDAAALNKQYTLV